MDDLPVGMTVIMLLGMISFVYFRISEFLLLVSEHVSLNASSDAGHSSWHAGCSGWHAVCAGWHADCAGCFLFISAGRRAHWTWLGVPTLHPLKTTNVYKWFHFDAR